MDARDHHHKLVTLCDRLAEVIEEGGSQLRELARNFESPGACADAEAAALIMDADVRQELLEELKGKAMAAGLYAANMPADIGEAYSTFQYSPPGSSATPPRRSPICWPRNANTGSGSFTTSISYTNGSASRINFRQPWPVTCAT